jgi:hypothetical protein
VEQWNHCEPLKEIRGLANYLPSLVGQAVTRRLVKQIRESLGVHPECIDIEVRALGALVEESKAIGHLAAQILACPVCPPMVERRQGLVVSQQVSP